MKRSLAAAGALSLALFLSACSTSESTDTESTPAPMPDTTASETMATPAESAPAAAEANIVETAQQAGEFTTLVAALEAAGLDDDLQGDGPFTVFAPTDDAFAQLPEGTLDTLLEDPTGQLTDILTYHVVADEVMAAQVVELDGQQVATLQGAELTVEVVDGGVVLVDGAGNRVNVVTTDVEANNGVIHVIDGVLLPSA